MTLSATGQHATAVAPGAWRSHPQARYWCRLLCQANRWQTGPSTDSQHGMFEAYTGDEEAIAMTTRGGGGATPAPSWV